ncbi:MAG: hypothetical protein M5R42_11630 [Rhodocyclaceae bacterium]|nr:hypothetical protein [Rhodocyclaceae bacterium]
MKLIASPDKPLCAQGAHRPRGKKIDFDLVLDNPWSGKPACRT